jgi:hypothetical protein
MTASNTPPTTLGAMMVAKLTPGGCCAASRFDAVIAVSLTICAPSMQQQV